MINEVTEFCEDCNVELVLTQNLVAQPDEEIMCPGCGQIYIVEVPEEEDEVPYLLRYIGPMEIALDRAKDLILKASSVLSTKTPWESMNKDLLLGLIRRARDIPDLPQGHRFALSYVVDALLYTPDYKVKTDVVAKVFKAFLKGSFMGAKELGKILLSLEKDGFELFPPALPGR